jgi:hypothetical protein
VQARWTGVDQGLLWWDPEFVAAETPVRDAPSSRLRRRLVWLVPLAIIVAAVVTVLAWSHRPASPGTVTGTFVPCYGYGGAQHPLTVRVSASQGGRVVASTAQARTVEQLHSGPPITYRLNLPAGRYVITAVGTDIGKRSPAPATVTSGQTTNVTFFSACHG